MRLSDQASRDGGTDALHRPQENRLAGVYDRLGQGTRKGEPLPHGRRAASRRGHDLDRPVIDDLLHVRALRSRDCNRSFGDVVHHFRDADGARHRLGDDEGSIASLRKALQLDGDHSEARIYLANLLYDRGEF